MLPAHVVEQLFAAWRQRYFGVEDGRLLLELDFDQVGGVLREVAVLRHRHRNRLSLVMHRVERQQVIGGKIKTPAGVLAGVQHHRRHGQRTRHGLRDLYTGYNAHHAARGRGRFSIDGPDARVAGRLLEAPALVDAALRAVEFLRANAWRDGQLYASWKGGAARFPAYLDDHAFLLDALIEAMQARFRVEDLLFAREVADALLSKFADVERGGFWFTAAGEDPPLHRPKNFADDAMPSGNGIGAQALARLGWLTGEIRYLAAAESAIRGGYASLARAPEAHAAMLNALDEYLEPVEIVFIRGEAAEAQAWQAALAREYAPRRLVLAIPSGAVGLPEALAMKRPRDRTVAYVCRGPVCSEPIERLDALSASRP